MKTTAKVVLGLLLATAAAACGTATAATETVTASPSPSALAVPYPTVDPALDAPAENDGPTATPTEDAPVVQVNPEAKACGLLQRAKTLPAYSSRWDDVVIDAEYAAKSDAMYNAIYKAENVIFNTSGFNYESIAAQDILHVLDKFC